jgi:hypothetical protein
MTSIDKNITLLYDDKTLDMVYRIYAKHQGKNNVPFMKLEDFRNMFEEQQTAIYKQQIEEMQRIFDDDDPNNRFDN